MGSSSSLPASPVHHLHLQSCSSSSQSLAGPGHSGLDAVIPCVAGEEVLGRSTATPPHSLPPLWAKPQVEHSSKGSCSFVLWAALASTVTLCAEMMGRWWKPHPRGGEWLWAPHSTQGDIQDEIKKSLPAAVFQRLWVILWQCCSAETSPELVPKPDPEHVTPWAGGGQVLVWDRNPPGYPPESPWPIRAPQEAVPG